MSETEVHKGKLVPMVLDGWNLEECAEAACKKFGLVQGKYHDTWLECLKDEGYKHAYVRGETIYELQDKQLDADDISEATINKDRSIDYFLSFYNGGASLDEALDWAINKAENE